MNTKTLQSKSKRESVNMKDFNNTVHMLIELLGRDIDSTNPSRDKDMLLAIRDGLFRVEVSGQLFEYLKSFRNLLVRNFPECAVVEFNTAKHLELTKTVAKISVQPLMGKMQIQEFFKEFGVDMDNTQMGIFAITQFIEVIRRLPIKFFEDPDNRLQAITSMQRELDELIVLEEEEEQEMNQD